MHEKKNSQALEKLHDTSICDVKLSAYNSIFVTATLNPINLKSIYSRPCYVLQKNCRLKALEKMSRILHFFWSSRIIKFLFFIHFAHRIFYAFEAKKSQTYRMDFWCKPVSDRDVNEVNWMTTLVGDLVDNK